MSLIDKPAAYRDCYDLYEHASSVPGGIRAPVATEREAKLYQLRMNKARSIMRAHTTRAYPPSSPLYDTSPYDAFQVAVRGPDAAGEFWIYVIPHGRPDIVAAAEPADPELAALTPTTYLQLPSPHDPHPTEPADLD